MVTDDNTTDTRRQRSMEVWRQILHTVSGLWAVCLRWTGPLPLMFLAAAALLFNLRLMPRIARGRLWRPAEAAAGRSTGMIAYPATVLALLALFYARPEVAAAGWGLLAFGDGAATLAGTLTDGRRLAWNRRKSWAGLLAYWMVGWVAVACLVGWTAPDRYAPFFLVIVSGIVALISALFESVPQRIDDNLTVPVIGSLILICLLDSEGGWLAWLQGPSTPSRILLAIAINAILVVAARALKMLDLSGALAAWAIGAVVLVFLSWAGYLVLLTFFVLGSSATWLARKARPRRWQPPVERQGRRVGNALANGSVAVACAVFAVTTTQPSLFIAAFLCSLAAAAADTVESELGQVWGGRTVLITSWRRVEPGVDGGISLFGTLAGLTAAAATVGAGWLTGLCPLTWVPALAVLAVIATLLESVAGATLESRGLLDNEGVNFANTLLAALLGAAMAQIVG